MLTLRESAEYFHIGEKKMRQIVDENMDANFLLESGNRVMIKRKLFRRIPGQSLGNLIFCHRNSVKISSISS